MDFEHPLHDACLGKCMAELRAWRARLWQGIYVMRHPKKAKGGGRWSLTRRGNEHLPGAFTLVGSRALSSAERWHHTYKLHIGKQLHARRDEEWIVAYFHVIHALIHSYTQAYADTSTQRETHSGARRRTKPINNKKGTEYHYCGILFYSFGHGKKATEYRGFNKHTGRGRKDIPHAYR